jgi:hypothetical protein
MAAAIVNNVVLNFMCSFLVLEWISGRRSLAAVTTGTVLAHLERELSVCGRAFEHNWAVGGN